MNPGRRIVPRLTLAACLIVCALTASCQKHPTAAELRNAGPPRLLKPSELSDAEKRYGQSATRSDVVTYQPDVVLLPDGADAIRGVGADGLTWMVDPGFEGVKSIRPGAVLLLTSRAVGRVLAVEQGGDGLHVVLGPVDITEVIRDGQFNLNQPVDFAQGISYATPEVFDTPMPLEPVMARLARPKAGGMFVRPVAFTTASERTIHQFAMTPFIDASGVGVRITSNAGGVMFLGQAVLYLKAPRVHFALDIKGGRVNTAEVELSGVGGLLMEFEAAMSQPTDANINAKRFAANDFSIPISGVGGVPLAVHLRQQFLLRTAFTSTGTLKARGYYTLSGGIRAGYRNGQFGVGGPTGFTAKETLLPSLDGVAMGAAGMVMTHHLNVIVGLGAAGFVAGPYAFLNSSVTGTRGSSIGLIVCRQETVSMAVGAGVGYQIPEPVTNAINAVLSALHIRERINGSGGIESKPVMIAQKGWYHPPVKACGG